MVKDDDLDLELDDEPVRSARRPATPAAPRPAPARPAEPRPVAAVAPTARPVATPAAPPARKGFLSGISDSLAGVRSFHWNVRTFLMLLAVIVVIAIIAENWMPIRFYFFGFAFEIPKALSFILDVALGALLMWLWMRRPGPGAEASP